MTGLPPLDVTLTPAQRRSLELWLGAAVERVGREARASSPYASDVASRVAGAQRLAFLLAETLTPPAPRVESSETGGST